MKLIYFSKKQHWKIQNYQEKGNTIPKVRENPSDVKATKGLLPKAEFYFRKARAIFNVNNDDAKVNDMVRVELKMANVLFGLASVDTETKHSNCTPKTFH